MDEKCWTARRVTSGFVLAIEMAWARRMLVAAIIMNDGVNVKASAA